MRSGTFSPPETTRPREHIERDKLTCPRDGVRRSIADCVAVAPNGCRELLPCLGCALVPVFGIHRGRQAGGATDAD